MIHILARDPEGHVWSLGEGDTRTSAIQDAKRVNPTLLTLNQSSNLWVEVSKKEYWATVMKSPFFRALKSAAMARLEK